MRFSQVKVLVNSEVHSEHEKAIRRDFKSGSMERSIDVWKL
jgi:hypothetical protein